MTPQKGRKGKAVSSKPISTVRKYLDLSKPAAIHGEKAVKITPQMKNKKAATPGSSGNQKFPVDYGYEDDTDSYQALDQKKAQGDYLTNRVPQHRSKKDHKSVVEVLQDREKYFSTMTESVQKLSERAQGKVAHTPAVVELSHDEIWGKTIVTQMGRMNPLQKDFFMAHVFDICMKAVRGVWPEAE
jgi:hypothetical protein